MQPKPRLGYEPIETSHWHQGAPPALPLPVLAGRHDADIVIIGAGYAGLSAALHAAEAGARVIVLEAGEPGWAASGRNAAHVCPVWGGKVAPSPDRISERFGAERGARMNRLVAGSANFVFDLIARHGIACDARQTGHLSVARTEKSLAALVGLSRQYERHGAPIEVIGRDALDGMVRSARYAGGVRHVSGGTLNPLAYARGLAAAASGKGVQIFAGSRALSAEHDGGRWQVRTAGGEAGAPVLLYATGAYTDGLAPPLAALGYNVACGAIVSEPIGDRVRAIIPFGGPFADVDDPAVFGPTIDCDGRLILSVLVGRSATPQALAKVAEARLRRVFPGFEIPRWERAWFGWFQVTPDHLPRVLQLGPGAYAAAGCNGIGITMATITGREIARLATGTAAADIDMPLTAPTRAPMPEMLSRVLRHVAAPLLNRFGT